MKRSLFAKSLKKTVLAVPAAALMLGAAQAGTTVGLNFQSWYYDSGTNPQTIGFNNGYSDYNTTGFPVTANAFGVKLANWFNTDPLGSQYNANSINQLCTFGGTATTFAGGLSCNVNAPKGAKSSGAGELNALNPYPPNNMQAAVAPGNNEVYWGNIVGDDADPFSVSVSGLAAKFPNGYVVQSMSALGALNSDGSYTYPLLPSVDFTDGSTTSTSAYHIYYVQNNPGAQWKVSTVGVSDSSGVFTADTIHINSRADGTGEDSSLSGFIITDQPVISQNPADVTIPAGETVNLSASVAALPNALFYQWRTNGVPIPGANSATYFKADATVADSANYDLVVTNLYGSATSTVATVTVFVPAVLTWDANTGTSGAQDGSGNWDNGITANWWNGSGDVVWDNLGNAVFGAGGTGVYSVNVTSSAAVNSLTFNSGNYTITGSTNQVISLTGASSVTANTNATIGLPLAGTSGLVKGGNGALTLSVQQSYTGGTTVNAGTLNLSYNNGAGGTVQGTLTVNSNATVVTTVNNALGYSGTYWVRTINLNYGTLSTSIASSDNGWGTTINMTGGTLGSTVANGRFAMGNGPVFNVTGTNIPSVINANLTVRDASPDGIIFNVTRGSAATDLNISGNLLSQGTGGITLNGGGIMQLSGVNTYTGETIVNDGTLKVGGQLTGNGAVTLNDAAALSVTAGSLAAAVTTANLTLGASGTGTDQLGFVNLSSTTLAPISAGGLVVNNPVTVNIAGTIPVIGQYPLVQYGGESGSGAFTLGTLPSGVSATLVDDHVSSVYLNVTATPVQTESWNGNVNGNWDFSSTANWLIGTTPSAWAEFNIVVFDDTAVGTTSVTITTNVHPASVTFNNSAKNYTFSGSGAIAGSAGLTLNGAGMVTLNNTNTYTGGTVISGGTLSISNDASLGAGDLTFNYGVLDVAGTAAFTSAKNILLSGSGEIQVANLAGAALTSPITGGGSLIKSGPGTLTFGVQQTYTGGTTINGGILDLTGGGGSAGTIRGTATVNSGGTLRLSTGDATGYTYGPNNLSYINLVGGTLNINSTANQTLGSATITMTGGAITGLAGGNLDFFGGGSALSTYPSSVPSTISGVQLSPLRQGSTIFDVQAGTTPDGIDLDISSVLRAAPSGDAVGGVLTKTGSGTMRLSAVNTYPGGTEVQGGTLILTGRLVGGGPMTVDDGATLNVSSGVNTAILSPTNDLTLGFGGALNLGFANVNSTTVPLVMVSNVLNSDTVTVNIGGKVSVGQFPLIKYGGTETGAGSFTLGTLPSGVSATLVNNIAGKSLDLQVTSAPLSILTDISGGTNYAYAGANYTLTIVAGGSPTLGYQWYHDDLPINGATSPTLMLAKLTPANDGSYYVLVTNGASIFSLTNHLIVLSDSGYTAMTIATGPTAYWPLNESAGPIAVDYMGGHNASYSGAGMTFGVAGPVGTNVVTVNGTSGQVAYPYSADLNPAGSFTAEGWFNPSSVTASLVCALSANHAASPRSGWLIYMSTAGWEFRTYNQNTTATAVDIAGGTPTVGVWNHVAVVWDGSKGYIYVNGVLANTSAATNFVANPDSAFTIGSRSDSAFFWGGSVGDVAFYSRALTAQEIQAHAQNSPIVNIGQDGSNVILSWVPNGGGTLVASPTVDGTYTNVPAATSPWTNAPAGNQFYRVKF